MREPQIAFELPTDPRSPGRLRDLARDHVVAELPPFLVDLVCALALHRALGASAQPVALRELRRALPGTPSEKSLVTEAYELTVYDFTFALTTVSTPELQVLTVDHLHGLALPAPERLRLHLNTRCHLRRRKGTRAARTDIARVLDDLAVVDRLVNDGDVNEAARVLCAEHLSPNLIARSVSASRSLCGTSRNCDARYRSGREEWWRGIVS